MTAGPKNNGSPRIIVVFRDDDPSALSDVAHERELLSVFSDHGLPLTISVIPNVARTNYHDPRGTGEARLDENPRVVEFLREFAARTGSEIALHGFTHRADRRSLPERHAYFEFGGRGLEEQESLLRTGSEIIQQALGARPLTFVPPWNCLDADTLTACERLGFEAVSAEEFLLVPEKIVPFGVNADLTTFDELLEQARRGEHRVFIHLMFHTPMMKLPRDKELLSRVVRRVAEDPECEAMTILGAARRFGGELREFNRAGRNIVELHKVTGSVRARAHLCYRGCARLVRHNPLARIQAQARQQYRAGDYAACAQWDGAIDRFCAALMWSGRLAALLGLFLLARVGAALCGGVSGGLRLWLAGGLVAGLTALGLVVARRTIAPDTRKEIAWLAALGAVGALAGLCL